MPLARSTWIQNARWDVGWLIGSAVVVPIVLLLVYAGAPSAALNLGVTAIIGGPHLFSTYYVTYLDPRFRRAHAVWLIGASLLVPAFVVTLAVADIQVLLSVFIFAASAHVLQQNAYLADVYRARARLPEARFARLVDYGVLMLSMYPLASFKLVSGTFLLGDIPILLPRPLLVPATCFVVCAAFGTFLVAWIAKTVGEIRRRELNGPKTLLIATTTVVAFWVPVLASGERLELAFQSVNAWHSIQYLGIVAWIVRTQHDRGLASGRRPTTARLYGGCFLATIGLLGVLLAVAKLDPLGLRYEQYYYAGVLSFLLIHYVLDAYLFFAAHRIGALPDRVPYALAVR